METNKKESVKAQGAETQEIKEKKTQKKSVSYALKAIVTHVKTLHDGEIITKEDAIIIADLVRKGAEKFIKEEYGI